MSWGTAGHLSDNLQSQSHVSIDTHIILRTILSKASKLQLMQKLFGFAIIIKKFLVVANLEQVHLADENAIQ